MSKIQLINDKILEKITGGKATYIGLRNELIGIKNLRYFTICKSHDVLNIFDIWKKKNINIIYGVDAPKVREDWKSDYVEKLYLCNEILDVKDIMYTYYHDYGMDLHWYSAKENIEIIPQKGFFLKNI